ncbi:MAG TPA: hypothetical protein VM146_15345 [Steroidobacteraceae bacterium]|nr:hypothetical protein [Steroidobacteraceae bacterium]
MFRRGFYISELVPLLLSLGMLGAALYGLLTERVLSVTGQHRLLGLVAHSQDPGLYWMSISVYLLVGAVLGYFSLRNLRGY